MALTTMPFSSNILDDFKIVYKDNILEAGFGNGYVQITNDGIDSTAFSSELTLGNLDIAQVTVLLDFFLARGMGDAFYITLPDVGDTPVLLTGYARPVKTLNKFNVAISVKEYKYPGVTP